MQSMCEGRPVPEGRPVFCGAGTCQLSEVAGSVTLALAPVERFQNALKTNFLGQCDRILNRGSCLGVKHPQCNHFNNTRNVSAL